MNSFIPMSPQEFEIHVVLVDLPTNFTSDDPGLGSIEKGGRQFTAFPGRYSPVSEFVLTLTLTITDGLEYEDVIVFSQESNYYPWFHCPQGFTTRIQICKVSKYPQDGRGLRKGSNIRKILTREPLKTVFFSVKNSGVCNFFSLLSLVFGERQRDLNYSWLILTTIQDKQVSHPLKK